MDQSWNPSMGKPTNENVAGDAASATLPEGSLRELVNAGVVTSFLARGQAGGFAIEAILGSEPGRLAILGNTRSSPRLFASLGTVALLLRKLGINQFAVDSTNYVPGRVRAARPDRSVAMKNAVRASTNSASGKSVKLTMKVKK